MIHRKTGEVFAVERDMSAFFSGAMQRLWVTLSARQPALMRSSLPLSLRIAVLTPQRLV